MFIMSLPNTTNDHTEAESDVVGRTTEQEARTRRGFLGTAHMASELVHRLIIGRIRGMPERLGRKLTRLIDPPWALRTYGPTICTCSAFNCDVLVLGARQFFPKQAGCSAC